MLLPSRRGHSSVPEPDMGLWTNRTQEVGLCQLLGLGLPGLALCTSCLLEPTHGISVCRQLRGPEPRLSGACIS